jgi:hypothetical protein
MRDTTAQSPPGASGVRRLLSPLPYLLSTTREARVSLPPKYELDLVRALALRRGELPVKHSLPDARLHLVRAMARPVMLRDSNLGDTAVALNNHPYLDLAGKRWILSQPELGIAELKELLPLSDHIAQHGRGQTSRGAERFLRDRVARAVRVGIRGGLAVFAG